MPVSIRGVLDFGVGGGYEAIIATIPDIDLVDEVFTAGAVCADDRDQLNNFRQEVVELGI